MRLFFAAIPDSEVRGRLACAARALDAAAAARFVPAEQYHMTLIFLGEVPESRMLAVREAAAGQRLRSVTLRFDRWEYWRESGVLVAATSEWPQALANGRSGLERALARRAISFDDKPLRPHLTVARKVAQAPVLPALSEVDWTMRELALVASARGDPGSIYTVVDSWPLLDIWDGSSTA
jgi:2'-5' RNA ligase